jgi:hypothetical protein
MVVLEDKQTIVHREPPPPGVRLAESVVAPSNSMSMCPYFLEYNHNHGAFC